MSRRPRRRSHLAERELDGEMIIYDPGQQRAYALNRSAAAIWALCDGTETVVQMAEALGQRFACPPGLLLPDVQAAVAALADHGLVDTLP